MSTKKKSTEDTNTKKPKAIGNLIYLNFQTPLKSLKKIAKTTWQKVILSSGFAMIAENLYALNAIQKIIRDVMLT